MGRCEAALQRIGPCETALQQWRSFVFAREAQSPQVEMAQVSLLKNEKPAVRRAGRRQNHSRSGRVDAVTGVKQLFGASAIGGLPEQRPVVRGGRGNEGLA